MKQTERERDFERRVEGRPRRIDLIADEKRDEQVISEEDTVPMKKRAQHRIAEVPRRQVRFEITIGIDLVMSGAITLQAHQREKLWTGRSRTTPKAIDKWFVEVPPAFVAMEAGTHSSWISEQLEGSVMT